VTKAEEFAASIGARVTFPTNPKERRNLYELTDVRKTWERFRPEIDFRDDEAHRRSK